MRAYEIFEDPQNPTDVKDALTLVMSLMKHADRGRASFHGIKEEHRGWLSFEVRDWGIWQMPAGEEDDGDYDWEELSSESYVQLKDIVDQVKRKYPNVVVTYQAGEKNWIVVQAKSQA